MLERTRLPLLTYQDIRYVESNLVRTSYEKKTRWQLLQDNSPLSSVGTSQHNDDGSGHDSGPQFGGLYLPSVVQGLLGVLSRVESGLK